MGHDENAARWFAGAVDGPLQGSVPDLAFAEVANALVVSVRKRETTHEDARRVLETLAASPLAVESVRTVAQGALAIALTRGLSAYDACYAALAEASGAILVTADAGLAAAVDRSALLPGAAPPG